MIVKRYYLSILYEFLKNSKVKPILGFGQKMAANGEVYFGFVRSDQEPILIYQMGKVGSTSVSRSLKAAELTNYVFNIHFLSDDLFNYKKFYIDSGIVPIPYHIELGLALRKRISNNKINRFKIISLVRDPIARQISDVFQNPEIMGIDIRNQDGLLDRNKAIALIEDRFSDLKVFDYTFEWFDRELKSVFEIDVFSRPFGFDSGWTIYKGNNADALIIRLEDLSGIGEDVISKYLGITQKISLASANVRAETPEAEAYQYVKNNLKINRAICEKIYGSRFVKHFYSGAQIERMIKKWV